MFLSDNVDVNYNFSLIIFEIWFFGVWLYWV